jgi:hypothetical protein
MSQRKGGGDMDIPPSAMIRTPGSDLRKSLIISQSMSARLEQLTCETVEKVLSSADFPPMRKFRLKVISVQKII